MGSSINRRFNGFRYEWQLDETRVVNSLCCFSVVPGFGPEDALHERLRVPVVKREPARLNLHHDSMPGQKDVIRGRQRKPVFQRLIGYDRFRNLQTLAITSTKHVRG